MTVNEALNLLNCSKAELGRMLGLNRSAISLWKNNVPIAREYQIRDIAAGRKPLRQNEKSS